MLSSPRVLHAGVMADGHIPFCKLRVLPPFLGRLSHELHDSRSKYLACPACLLRHHDFVSLRRHPLNLPQGRERVALFALDDRVGRESRLSFSFAFVAASAVRSSSDLPKIFAILFTAQSRIDGKNTFKCSFLRRRNDYIFVIFTAL